MDDVKGEDGLVSGERFSDEKFQGNRNLRKPGREAGCRVVIKTHPGVGLLGKHQLRVHDAPHVALHSAHQPYPTFNLIALPGHSCLVKVKQGT